MKLTESNKSPSTHTVHISDFSCRSSDVRSVTWPRPLYAYGGILKLLILQYKWYNPNSNSDTSNIIVMHCRPVSLPYFRILYFVWRHGSIWGHQRFSRIISDQIEIDSREKASLWWHWAFESTDMQLDPARSISDLKGCDLMLTSGSTLTLIFTEQ